jgi:plastocyanin
VTPGGQREVLHGRPGALTPSGLLALLLVMSLSAGGCDSRSGPANQAVARAEIVLGGRGTEEHVVPSRVIVQVGGSVVFRTVDSRVHTVEFSPSGMTAEAQSYLRRTGQQRSPPLLERGTEYTVTFEGAPPGFYPFLVRGPGVPVEGAVVVE